MKTMFKLVATVGGVDAGRGAEVLGDFAGRFFASQAEAEAAASDLAGSVPDGHEGIAYEAVEATEREVLRHLDAE